MQLHDWTRVSACIFHDLHQTWIVDLARALNGGKLPAGFYALAEQIAGGWGSQVVTLDGPILDAKAELNFYISKASVIAIRHSSNHKVAAMIEIVSPGNKHSKNSISKFVDKAEDMLAAGVHLLIIDLIPPSSFDRQGIHGAIWQNHSDEPFIAPVDKPLTLAAYIGGGVLEAYVEPTAVGCELIDMPLFLDSDSYVPTPLAMTYQSAWEAVPAVWRRAIEDGAGK